MSVLWKNRAGNQRALVELSRPTTEHELCSIVARAAETGTRVKVVGAGRSFSDVAITDGLAVELCDYGRILSLDTSAGLVSVQAGAPVRELSEFLWTRGLALDNLGDFDDQTIGGTAATASHGTGARFRGISAGIVGLRIIDGAGAVHDCTMDSDPELFRAARAGLGALGVVSTITLRVVPAFNLRLLEEARLFGAVVESFDDLLAAHDHFEFSWVPHTERVLTRTGRRNTEPIESRGRWDHWRAGGSSARNPQALPDGPLRYNEPAHRVWRNPRGPRFIESEYAVPIEAATAAAGEVRRWIESNGAEVLSMGVRVAAGDDIALSPSQGRPTGYISVRCRRRAPHEGYLRAVDAIMSAHGGRPHWGKVHHMGAAALAPLYPEWDLFQAVRSRIDPAGVFENSYTRRCLGPVHPGT